MSNKEVEVTKADGSKVKVYVTNPTAIAIQKADIYRAKVWNECLDEGIKTKEELAIVMEKRGIWGQSQIKEELEIIESLNKLEKEGVITYDRKRILIRDYKYRWASPTFFYIQL